MKVDLLYPSIEYIGNLDVERIYISNIFHCNGLFLCTTKDTNSNSSGTLIWDIQDGSNLELLTTDGTGMLSDTRRIRTSTKSWGLWMTMAWIKKIRNWIMETEDKVYLQHILPPDLWQCNQGNRVFLRSYGGNLTNSSKINRRSNIFFHFSFCFLSFNFFVSSTFLKWTTHNTSPSQR